MSSELSIQGSPSPTVVTQQTDKPAPTASRNVYLATAVVSAIILVASIIFLYYLIKNYTCSEGFTEGWAASAFVGCIVIASPFSFAGFVASLRAFLEVK